MTKEKKTLYAPLLGGYPKKVDHEMMLVPIFKDNLRLGIHGNFNHYSIWLRQAPDGGIIDVLEIRHKTMRKVIYGVTDNLD